jgi:hypothetical protein
VVARGVIVVVSFCGKMCRHGHLGPGRSRCASPRKALILITLTAQGSIAPTAEGRVCAAADTAKRECQAETWPRVTAR